MTFIHLEANFSHLRPSSSHTSRNITH